MQVHRRLHSMLKGALSTGDTLFWLEPCCFWNSATGAACSALTWGLAPITTIRHDRAVMQVEQTLVGLRLTMQKRKNKTGMPKIMTMYIHLLHHWTKSPVPSQLSPEKITNYTANVSPFRKSFYTISFFFITHRIMDSKPIWALA